MKPAKEVARQAADKLDDVLLPTQGTDDFATEVIRDAIEQARREGAAEGYETGRKDGYADGAREMRERAAELIYKAAIDINVQRAARGEIPCAQITMLAEEAKQQAIRNLPLEPE